MMIDGGWVFVWLVLMSCDGYIACVGCDLDIGMLWIFVWVDCDEMQRLYCPFGM